MEREAATIRWEIETIRRLEPEGQRISIKSLRERARLLQRVEQAPTEIVVEDRVDEEIEGV
jgi:hypothetical protein